jgi:hypothetical protein
VQIENANQRLTTLPPNSESQRAEILAENVLKIHQSKG